MDWKTCGVVLTLLKLCLVPSVTSVVSHWDSFCTEDKLYFPYIRIFQKGRNGALLRDRGPGFIDVNGLSDIYVCTNGLVMLYYTKTKQMGDIFEQGELHWAPHHCELYNPSCTTMGIDSPRKTLRSILLIGHPQDYRRPALQMFVAPTYDREFGKYVNITSLLMVGSDGECLIEKGVERARIRVRNVVSPYEGDTTTPGPLDAYKPGIFCQLDAQRKLGQRGIITLNKPGESFALKRTYPFENTPYQKLIKNQKSETGVTISPRFKATVRLNGTAKDDAQSILPIADEVYSLLLNDRKLRFVGCLRYPDFSGEQERIIVNMNNDIANKTKFEENTEYIPTEKEPPFWAEKVTPPWPMDTPADDTRFNLYAEGFATKEYSTIKEEVDKALKEYIEAKGTSPADPAKTKTAMYALETAKMKYSLWPFRETYIALKDYAKDMDGKIGKVWEELMKKVDDSAEAKIDEVSTLTANKSAHLYNHVMTLASERKFERRFEPYNEELVTQYANFTNISRILYNVLRNKSADLGPHISNAETLYSKFKVYKGLMKKALFDFENAIRTMERKRHEVEFTTPGDPFDKYFADTVIEIADGIKKPDGSEDNITGRACYALPELKDTCRSIKPNSARTCQLIKNRVGKGSGWSSPSDEWRQRVLDLLETIFKRVCPYLDEEFSISINRLIKGYLLGSPTGTGLLHPINGSRLYTVNHQYQTKVYNMTYSEMNVTDFGTLRPKTGFWDQIITALEHCSNAASPMEFWHNEEPDRPVFITYRKTFANNKSDVHYDVEDLFMEEKADLEFSFNWAVDMNWRIFSTVLGICMPHYEKQIPLISARFYALYSRDFLHPLRQIWMSNRDNIILKTILGSFYGTGKGDRWSKICMESSFMESGDRTYRPPRNLYVNAFTEMNYFTSGPMSGSSGRLADLL